MNKAPVKRKHNITEEDRNVAFKCCGKKRSPSYTCIKCAHVYHKSCAERSWKNSIIKKGLLSCCKDITSKCTSKICNAEMDKLQQELNNTRKELQNKNFQMDLMSKENVLLKNKAEYLDNKHDESSKEDNPVNDNVAPEIHILKTENELLKRLLEEMTEKNNLLYNLRDEMIDKNTLLEDKILSMENRQQKTIASIVVPVTAQQVNQNFENRQHGNLQITETQMQYETTATMPEQVESTKEKSISIRDRIEIFGRLEAGESCKDIAKSFGIRKSAVSWLKKYKEKCLKRKQLIDDCGDVSIKRKLYSGVEESPLEKALYRWVIQIYSMGESLTLAQLQSQARFFNKQLNKSSDVRVSVGFMKRFTERHAVTTFPDEGDKQELHAKFSEIYCKEVVQFFVENGYQRDCIYNADEASLYWKTLPNKMLSTAPELNASRREAAKDCVTMMVCANASGTHKLPLMVVGNSQKPKCIENIKVLPVTYKGQKNAWMNRKLTTQWYKEVFLPEIQRVHGPTVQCVLLLDNAPCHTSTEELNALCDWCIVKHVPANLTETQPLNQGIIEKFKRIYKKNLLRLALTEDSLGDVKKRLDSMNILQCCNFVASAWENVTSLDIRNGWKNFFPTKCSVELIDFDLQPDAFLDLISRVPGYDKIHLEDIRIWLRYDDEPGWEFLTDQEILSQIYVEEEDDCDGANDEDDDFENMEELLPIPSAKDALCNIETFSLWYQSQWDCTPESLLMLDRMRVLCIEHIVAEKQMSVNTDQVNKYN